MSKSSGPWSELERRQFEEGVIQFGWGKWMEINNTCIPTRSKDQIKSHAQKFSIHRKQEHAMLLRKHAAAMKGGDCGKKKKKKAAAAAAAATTTSTPVTKSARRPSRSSIKRAVATKSAVPTPVKVRRSSKSSIESVASFAPKPALAKAKKLYKEAVKKPKLGAQFMKLFTKSDTPKKHALPADQSSTDNDSDPGVGVELMEFEIPPTKVDDAGVVSELCVQLMQLESVPIKSNAADKPEVQMELKNSPTKSKADDELEKRDSATSFASFVSPSPSMKSRAEEAQELRGLMASLDYLDAWEDDSKDVEEDSFALALADDMLDINLEEGDIIPDVVDIVEDDSVVPIEQQIRSRALMHLRLQCQPSEVALDEITALLESPPDLFTSESKCTLMRQRIIKLATEVSDGAWWRDGNMPEGKLPVGFVYGGLRYLLSYLLLIFSKLCERLILSISWLSHLRYCRLMRGNVLLTKLSPVKLGSTHRMTFVISAR